MTTDRNIPNGKNGLENPLILSQLPKLNNQGVAKSATMGSIYHQKVIMTLSNNGFIKRVPISVYRSQHNRGKGIIGMVTRETDAMKLLCIADPFETLLCFTNKGKVFSLKWHEISAEAFLPNKGLTITDLLHFAAGEKVTALAPVPDLKQVYVHLMEDSPEVIGFDVSETNFNQEYFLLMATEKGEIKKSSLKLFDSIRSSGIIAMDIEEGDELVAAGICTDDDDVVLVTEEGQSIRFLVKSLRSSSRTSGGVRAIRLHNGDKLVGMSVVIPATYLMVVTANGYGKLIPIEQYKRQSRGGVGLKTLMIREENGKVAAAKLVSQTQQLILISKDGMVTSTTLKDKDDWDIPVLECLSQGVRLLRMDEGDRITAIASF